jgi:hypothetical protein
LNILQWSATIKKISKSKYESLIDEIKALAIKKNHDYGPENISYLGEKGCFVRISDKVNRLKHLVWEEDNKNPQVLDETVEDTLIDLANYALITILLMRKHWGNEDTF